MLPPNDDDLTLTTDPVFHWCLYSLAFAVGVGVVFAVAGAWPL
jgi:hypothetical protein